MFAPVLLIALATAAAGLMAYGTHPDWAQYDVGLSLIMATRRLQWPLAAVSIIFCLVVCATVISGARRAWWLIGLAPVLALFVHRFATSPLNRFGINEDPQFVAAAEGRPFVRDEDYVVGLTFEDQPYAYPYAALWGEPVVVQANHDKRMMLMWSAGANRAVAVAIDRGLHARELDVVSMPDNALLLYNSRLGQFINGLTGRTVDGAMPDSFQGTIPTTKTTWKHWRTLNPGTKLLARRPGAGAPRGPIVPMGKRLAGDAGVPFEARVSIVSPSTRPAALDPAMITASPTNVVVGGVPILVFRDERGLARAFDRRIEIDLFPRFKPNTDKRRKHAAFVDADTDTGWSAAGVAVDGERKGQRLAPIPIEEDVYWGVMKRWYPDLELHEADAPATPVANRS